jgi:hypothetical protein
MAKPPMKKAAPAKAKAKPMPVKEAMPAHDEMKWKAQDALRTLKEAHKIKQDPHLMAHVKTHAADEKKALASVIRRKT